MASSRGQAASVLFYFVVALVAASSVAFGLDWMQAPMPPMPETEASVQAAKLAAHLPPPRTIVVTKAKPRSVYPAQPAPQAPSAGQAIAAVDAANTQQSAAPPAPAIAAPEQATQPTPAAAEQPKCDIAACSAAYHSFRASDCTWQPFDGPRRFCDKGQPPQEQATNSEVVDPSQFSDKCDVEACRTAYFTFDPTDCTYQPSNGPRRLCTKGTPPKPATAAAPAAAVPAAAAVAPVPAAVSGKCDVEACKQAYFTFNPADCTYQPSDGPRRLCTKGTPPKPQVVAPPDAAPEASIAPAAAVPPAATTAPAAVTAPNGEQAKQEAPASAAPAAAPPPVAAVPAISTKCDVEACKRAYISFSPADCTYQPSEGPRRLCTKGVPPKPQAAAPAAAPDHPVPPALVPAQR
jgi:hypothetical protein